MSEEADRMARDNATDLANLDAADRISLTVKLPLHKGRELATRIRAYGDSRAATASEAMWITMQNELWRRGLLNLDAPGASEFVLSLRPPPPPPTPSQTDPLGEK